ncbi:HipA N-terminal domain-containing protein [Phaeobacter sp. B1627]|uniref:HipA N-terminal domain-containing protein n=1 Tax=Phaeobacter sp. B1627 TaxID=2583809 RepID=UPI001C4008BE|nr:HipA N-terminal domain-containing protein [Phaeobacter sp. B1627]
MADFEVHVDLNGRLHPVGFAHSNRVRGGETILFEYDPAWLKDAERFSLEPALPITRGAFAPPAGLSTFGSIGDSAPDTWGRRFMQRAERRSAERDRRAVRTLTESDYLLSVADETRLCNGCRRRDRPTFSGLRSTKCAWSSWNALPWPLGLLRGEQRASNRCLSQV